MTEIRFDTIAKELSQQEQAGYSPVYFLFGEEFLRKSVLDQIVSAITGKDPNAWEPMDGTTASMGEALDAVNTFSLLGGRKVVGFMDARIFDTKAECDRLLEKAKQASLKGKPGNGATAFLRLLALKGISLDAVTEDANKETIYDGKGEDWLSPLVTHCLDAGLVVPVSENDGDLLSVAIEKGFPEGHHLIITADTTDRRKKLFQQLKQSCCVVDCSVPSGNRKQDRDARDQLLRERVTAVLGRSGKTIENQAVSVLMELTGFDLRTLSGNLEKLIDFSGSRRTISEEDVRSVLKRTRQDPIFTFTGAVCDRNPAEALRQLGMLLDSGMHPLQLLTALVNQVRKLVLAKDFTVSAQGEGWAPRMSYDAFTRQVMPSLVQHEEERLQHRAALDPKPKGKGKKKKKTTDLSIAGNGKSPYPVFQLLIRADRFTLEELMAGVQLLADTDFRLKSGAMDPRVALEHVVLKLALRSGS